MPTGPKTPVPTSVGLCDFAEGCPPRSRLPSPGIHRDWQAVGVYSDNDVSARSVSPCPARQRLLGGIQARTVDAIICWRVDRRQDPRRVGRRHRPSRPARHRLATVTGEIDLATPIGRLVARTLGAAARQSTRPNGKSGPGMTRKGLWVLQRFG
ncbi:recombinase family protein [Nonomuraea roseoviolacea]